MVNTYNPAEAEKRAKQLIEEAKGYYIILSTKDTIKCDSDEIRHVMEGIEEGELIQVRQGIINPSFFVSIVEDHKRNQAFKEEVQNALRSNNFEAQYSKTEFQIKKLPELKKLKDIFSSALPQNNKQIQGRN